MMQICGLYVKTRLKIFTIMIQIRIVKLKISIKHVLVVRLLLTLLARLLVMQILTRMGISIKFGEIQVILQRGINKISQLKMAE
jgi:hypothetical protein